MKVYNTLKRQKEEFVPINDKKVGIYSCGPTVYWNQHIGNMYAFLSWDVLVRTLRYLGYDVTWMMNITDVGHMTSDQDAGDDKMEKGAAREGLTPWEIAKKYEGQFLESMDLLNIKRPDVLSRATDYIEEQIKLAQKIEQNGFTYKTKTGLVFDTSKFAEYAKFANLKLDEMESGARVEVDTDKKNPWDFLLWVTNQPSHIMKWNSPWGEGFPGWHLECTAMSTTELGETFDIHTGGIEHIGVHHTNEIAQGYGAFGHNTTNYWMHNAWLTLKDGKMSKSLGNVYTIQDLVKMGFNPMVFRYLVLSSHYRKGLTFSLDSMKAAETALNKLRGLNPSVAEVTSLPSGDLETHDKGEVNKDLKKEFIEAISDDLAMPEAMAVVWKTAKSELNEADKWATLLDFDKVLGLNLQSRSKKEEIPSEIVEMSNQRLKFKQEKNWVEADKLREEMRKLGYVVEDSQESSTISRIQ